MKKYIEHHESAPPPASEPISSLRKIAPPDGYAVYQFIAVNKHTQHLVFSNDGENWFSFDGLPVK
jgi:hypothetical protein